MDTLILIPTIKIYVFLYSRQTDGQTDGRTDGRTDGQRNTLAARGPEELFFQLLCQFLVLAGNRFWIFILMCLEYNTVVVLC